MGNAIETWATRELPILQAALRRADAGELIDLADLQRELGFDPLQMRVALNALDDAGYLEVRYAGGAGINDAVAKLDALLTGPSAGPKAVKTAQ